MKTNRTRAYRSDAFAAVHESMEALHRVGAISKVTMREFDEACLTGKGKATRGRGKTRI
jgi:DNA-binding transcriptional regulator YiaG